MPFIRPLALFTFFALAAGVACGQGFPTKPVKRGRGISRKNNLLNTNSVSGAEYRADIVGTANIVQKDAYI